MVFFDETIVKRVRKGQIPAAVFSGLRNALVSVDVTGDLSLFDIRRIQVTSQFGRVYWRLRKGKYRAIFFLEGGNIYVVALGTREEVYVAWR